MTQWEGRGEAHTFKARDSRKLGITPVWGGAHACPPVHPPPRRPRESLTGQLGPLGPWVVDAAHGEPPQSLREQFPVADPESQEDAVDFVLGWWLWRREQRGASVTLLTPTLLSAPHAASSDTVTLSQPGEQAKGTLSASDAQRVSIGFHVASPVR